MNVTGVVDVSHQFSKGNSRAELAGSCLSSPIPGGLFLPRKVSLRGDVQSG